MNIIEFEQNHLFEIKPQRNQSAAPITEEYAQTIQAGDCFTGVQDGRVVAIGGVVPVCEGRGFMHLIVAEGIPHQWVKLYRAATRLINAVRGDYRRIEALSAFDEADRWLVMLGFQYEGTLRSIMPDGSDAKSYSIVRK